ncbi:MAG: hypothetical protein ACKN9W_05770 [Methylococcus sp.]
MTTPTIPSKSSPNAAPLASADPVERTLPAFADGDGERTDKNFRHSCPGGD